MLMPLNGKTKISRWKRSWHRWPGFQRQSIVFILIQAGVWLGVIHISALFVYSCLASVFGQKRAGALRRLGGQLPGRQSIFQPGRRWLKKSIQQINPNSIVQRFCEFRIIFVKHFEIFADEPANATLRRLKQKWSIILLRF